ncbi:MAG: hypothetical protein JST30_15700 [Armatimonadetes bacterium]|nr:hypothetical protein [Armatimonadota bacterium]
MKFVRFSAATVAALSMVAPCLAAKVYVLSSSYTVQDAAISASLTSAGHTAVIGLPFNLFDGSVSLAGYDAVFFQSNYNWTAGDMPAAGQQQLLSFVNNGGGLITSEWTLWLVASGRFQDLKNAFPSVETTSYNGDTMHHFQKVTPETTINSGMPDDFQLAGDNVAGGETNVSGVYPGSVVFYATVNYGNFVGLSGRDFGQGRVAQFSQTVGEQFLSDPLGFRLTGNVVEWVSHGAASQQVNPVSVSVKFGKISGGGLGDISDIDGKMFRVCKFIVPNQSVAPITVEVEGNSPLASPSHINFRTYGKMSISGLFSETVDLYDWTQSAFSTTAVNTVAVNQNLKAVGVNADAPQARFVSGTGRLRARYRIRQTGPAAAIGWCYDLDQAVWFVRQ